MKWVILIVQIMFILSCSAQKTSNERERDLYINELYATTLFYNLSYPAKEFFQGIVATVRTVPR